MRRGSPCGRRREASTGLQSQTPTCSCSHQAPKRNSKLSSGHLLPRQQSLLRHKTSRAASYGQMTGHRSYFRGNAENRNFDEDNNGHGANRGPHLTATKTSSLCVCFLGERTRRKSFRKAINLHGTRRQERATFKIGRMLLKPKRIKTELTDSNSGIDWI